MVDEGVVVGAVRHECCSSVFSREAKNVLFSAAENHI